MKVGVLDSAFASMPLESMLDEFAALGLEAVEIGAGNYPGAAHCDVQKLLSTKAERDRYLDAFERRCLAISALSCHGNPLHPHQAIAASHDAVFRDAVRLAGALGIGIVNLFSGCPGDGPEAKHPNWVTSRWPDEYMGVLAWQWDEVAVPYWIEAAGYAADHGVRLGFEMHPGFLVYNPRTMLELRRRVSPNVCVNLDPSHLFWQGIDPVAAIRELAEAIVHVHAKDTDVNVPSVARWGILDLDRTTAPPARPWRFRAAGLGHEVDSWARMLAALRETGFEGVLSIEHEDAELSAFEGVAFALRTLRDALSTEDSV